MWLKDKKSRNNNDFILSVPPRIVDSLSSSDMVQVMSMINHNYNPDGDENENYDMNDNHRGDDGNDIKEKESQT